MIWGDRHHFGTIAYEIGSAVPEIIPPTNKQTFSRYNIGINKINLFYKTSAKQNKKWKS